MFHTGVSTTSRALLAAAGLLMKVLGRVDFFKKGFSCLVTTPGAHSAFLPIILPSETSNTKARRYLSNFTGISFPTSTPPSLPSLGVSPCLSGDSVSASAFKGAGRGEVVLGKCASHLNSKAVRCRSKHCRFELGGSKSG